MGNGITHKKSENHREEVVKIMIKIENECCNCATAAYPCLGESCEKRHSKHLFCNRCGEEVDKLFIVDGEQVCLECLPEMFETIEL